MFTIMMLLTGVLSSLSTQDQAPSSVSSAAAVPAIYQSVHLASAQDSVSASLYPASSGYESLNGLTLQDRIEKANRLHGEPSERVPAYMAGEEYRYAAVHVGVYEEWIYYVSVPASEGSFTLNGHVLPMDAADIRERLGEPDFSADDGFGYEHDGQAIKVFVDPVSGLVRSIDLFDTSSV
ncbi:hypothetical protein [Saccharibacillus deserti]|uniref:hypothetical protein n=1 Tax=Saccharibacillus deserti TaxID=1634444 RepID=UPI0015577AF7|nr:hypothetical protein [Saccharibacillus deserti]